MNENQDIIREARNLLLGRLCGILATQSLDLPGYPFGSLIPYSLGQDGWPLMLLSHLAKHTRNLNAEPRCSLTITDTGEGDIQQLMRLTCLGKVTRVIDIRTSEAENHFRQFPGSQNYFEHLNFQFYRLQPERFYCVGGFGAARWMGVDRLENTV
ncbi:HugZ family pyridoxamine 5'-phosphate oxidase [Candidatus Vondammii sp. HM_W22]|uniref:HugZ family pyridoxamine 5'-phosphate oxidase n=1 Tax=Candidatus Vondammii sp. HM_W22 TaxID=2687299 RepID=UPI001F132BC9|nr:CREG family protein [Candidatus Vondammii sp. HM_W22]